MITIKTDFYFFYTKSWGGIMNNTDLLIEISNAISALESAAGLLKDLINPVSDNFRIVKGYEIMVLRAKKALNELEQKL